MKQVANYEQWLDAEVEKVFEEIIAKGGEHRGDYETVIELGITREQLREMVIKQSKAKIRETHGTEET